MFARRLRHAAIAFVATVAACSSGRSSGARPPRADFLVNTPDSAFWVTTTAANTRVRGAPIVLARFDGRFYELYAADDDYSYADALLVGERLYKRDLITGDSVLVFTDTLVPRVASAYARSHPDEEPLRPDEEAEAKPNTSATAEIDILDVSGPYASFEYHVDVSLPHRRTWHTTRRGVIDLRSGKEATLTDLFGSAAGARLLAAGRRDYTVTRDSILAERGSLHGDVLRAADALAGLEFDERSFALSSDDGALEVQFGIPGRGEGAAGNLVELDALPVDSAAWWSSLAGSLPKPDDSGNDRWTTARYRVLARYDTSGQVARLSLADSTRREWPLATVLGPVRRIDWLDQPAIGDSERKALLRAFDQAATYDENARVAVARRPASRLIPVRFSPSSSHR